MSATDGTAFRPSPSLPPSRGDGAGSQASSSSTSSTSWSTSGPALEGMGQPEQAETKALPLSSASSDGKAIAGRQTRVGSSSTLAATELNRAMADLLRLATADGKKNPKLSKDLADKLEAFAARASPSRDQVLHALVKSFELLARHEDPLNQWHSLFRGLAKRVFLALDVGGSLPNLKAALVAIPGGDVLALSPAKAKLPGEMMAALTEAVGTPVLGRQVPQKHIIEALFAGVSEGPASEKTGEWLRGMTRGLFGALGCLGSSLPGELDSPLRWAGAILRTLSGEQIAGMACGVMEGCQFTSLSYMNSEWHVYPFHEFTDALTVPQMGAVGAGAGTLAMRVQMSVPSTLKELAPVFESLDALRLTAFACGIAAKFPPELRNELAKTYARTYDYFETGCRRELDKRYWKTVETLELAATLASDPFAEFAEAIGSEDRLLRLETVLQIPGMARPDHARRLGALVETGVIARAQAETLAARVGPVFAFDFRIAYALSDLDGISFRHEEGSPAAIKAMSAGFAAVDAACNAYAQEAGFAAYLEETEGPAGAATAPPLLPHVIAQHLAALVKLLRRLQPPEKKDDAAVPYHAAREQARAKMSSFVDVFRSMPGAAGLTWPVTLEPEDALPSFPTKPPAVQESKEAGDTKAAASSKPASQEVQPSLATSKGATKPLDDD